MSEYNDRELYVTEVEQEAYDLGGQLCLPPNQVRNHVEHKADKYGKPYYVVIIESGESRDRAVRVRRKLFGS
jgi:hypothetical protein